MAITRCEKGHIYDSSLYHSCPTCSSEGYRIDFGNRLGATEAINMHSGNTAAENVGKTIGVPVPLRSETQPEIEDIGLTVAAGIGNVSVPKNAQRPVTGWLVCIKGCNMGRAFELHSDYNYIGSEKGDVIIPGDRKISREKHMMITYDPMEKKFYVSPASGANIIRHKGKALIGGAELEPYDIIETGDSKFMFQSFCGEKFCWEDIENEGK